MNETSNWLVHDHDKYDAALDECETLADEGLWGEAIGVYQQFVEDLKLHMRMEDEVLYPLYQERYGDPGGELTYLYAEHDNIARLLHDLDYVIKRKNIEHFLRSLKPLHEALSQHNSNEEALFLTVKDDSVLMRYDEIKKRLDVMHGDASKRAWLI